MTDLPPGWALARLDDVADIQGGIQKQPKRRPTSNKYPFLRVANVARGQLNLSEIHEVELFDGELERYRLEAGDLLVVEGNGSLDQLGRAAMWLGQVNDCVHQNHLIRVRPTRAMNPQYLEYVWNSSLVAAQIERIGASTSGLHTLSVSKLRPITVPVPPLVEQCRIVNSLETQVSLLDAAANLINDALRKMSHLELSTTLRAMAAVEHSTVRLACLLREPLTNGRSVPTRIGGFPVLRLSALTSGNIQLAEQKSGAWSRDQAEPFLVKAGDYLISRGNGSLSLVGRGSAVTVDPGDVAFPDTMIRIRPNEERLTLPYLALIWNLPMIRRQIEEKARTTAGIYKVNQSTIENIELPLPSLEDQVYILQNIHIVSTSIAAAHGATLRAKEQMTGLRHGLFREAFSGRLVQQDPTDERVSVLLARIKAERAAQLKTRHSRLTKKNKDSAQEST